ncbi:Hypothetical predicted protein [Olea europaea subsp. europaea]|uniref:Uncharacterized protein n=1 Tax=Olea europaea subsp. europaea TaxID=158383 RepID=A0A8S0UL40_OLEEU|nr:Hypothetical predicted protein [Olea europaea subsp. europaea]
MKPVLLVPTGVPSILPIFDAMAPGPSLALASARGPGRHHHHFDKEIQEIKGFRLLQLGVSKMG